MYSLASVNIDFVIDKCEKEFSNLEKEKNEKIENAILEMMQPKKNIFGKYKKKTREEVIEILSERPEIGSVVLNSRFDDIELYYLKKISKVQNILKLADLAKESGEEKMLLDYLDAEILGY